MKRGLCIGTALGVLLLFPLVLAGMQASEETNRDKVLATPGWQQKYDAFEPAAEMMEALKTRLGPDTRIDVYLGLWCPDSRNNVPPFIKILDRLGASTPVRYFNSPRKASRDVQFYVEEMKVEKVPTFVVYRNGREIGRIVENPKVGMLEDLLDILFK
ncbi:MAG: Thioredoxin [Acidobacteria bacterium]|nr:Thioredoxin [Acidobacteriota bacterium]